MPLGRCATGWLLAASLVIPLHALRTAAAEGVRADQPLGCRTDADCPVLACGPCTPGTAITQELLRGPSCYINPCLNPQAACSADHACVVGPGTTRNPAVWRSTPGR